MKEFRFVGSVFTEASGAPGSGEMRGSVSLVPKSGESADAEQRFYFKTFEEMAQILKRMYEENLDEH